jgi:Zn finger protein HypA/HybF involved in hydrogenase expression
MKISTRLCRNCGKKFATDRNENYCDYKCKNNPEARRKISSRAAAGRVIRGWNGGRKVMFGESFYKCKKCSSQEDLEIHHEIYPTKKPQITEAVRQGKIYLLCRACHKKYHSISKEDSYEISNLIKDIENDLENLMINKKKLESQIEALMKKKKDLESRQDN